MFILAPNARIGSSPLFSRDAAVDPHANLPKPGVPEVGRFPELNAMEGEELVTLSQAGGAICGATNACHAPPGRCMPASTDARGRRGFGFQIHSQVFFADGQKLPLIVVL